MTPKNQTPGQRIEEIRKRLGLTQTDFASLVGANSKGVVSTWEKGKHLPDSEILEKIAKVGNTSIDWIITGKIKADAYEIFESGFKGNLKEQAAKYFYPLADKFKMRIFPIVSKISAGTMKEYFESTIPEKTISVPYQHNNCIALEIDGDSMSTTIDNGDIVLIDIHKTVKDGDIAAIRLKSGEQFVKRFKRINGTIILYSDNIKYIPITVKETDIEILKKVVKVIKNLQ